MGIKYDDPYEDEPNWLTAVHGYFTGGVFLILVSVLAYHGFKVYQLIRNVRIHWMAVIYIGPEKQTLIKDISSKNFFCDTCSIFIIYFQMYL